MKRTKGSVVKRMYDLKVSINDIMDSYSQNHRIGDKKSIRRAYEFAEAKHKGMKRGSGEPYIHHPMRVARMIAQWGFESDTIAAALLHDVVEDCQTEISEIEALFGSVTALIVDAVTALSDKDFAGHVPTKAQKDRLSDVRLQQKMNEKALYVKIADRIDNLSTLDGVPEEKRIPKAEHTREILVPMAVLEHAYMLADTLEKLCFQTEHPEMYQIIETRADAIRHENSMTCLKTLSMLKALFSPDNLLDCSGLESCRPYLQELQWAPRSCVSIFRQLSREAENIKRDWQALLSKERMPLYDVTLILRDSILKDEDNLHPFELFFRYFKKILSSRGMYLLRYEEATYASEICFILADEMDNQYRLFIRTNRENQRYIYGSIIDSEGEFSIGEVNEIEPRDTYKEMIHVFDRDGRVIMIEKGATVLDFAFYIHSELGFHFEYAMIDDSKTQLPAYTRLNEGDCITIVANAQVVPNISWFNYIITRRAVHHLVNFIQRNMAAESRP